MSDILMVVVYCLLTLFWFAILFSCSERVFGKSTFPKSEEIKTLGYIFLVISLIFLLDSGYWAITNASRVGIINPNIHPVLYNGWAVSSIKLLFLLAAIAFWVVAVRSLKKMNFLFSEFYVFQLLNQTWDAIGILDHNGKVILWNKGAEKLYGFSSYEVLGKHIKEFLVPETRHQEIDEKLKQVRQSQVAEKAYHTERLTKDGDLIPVDISISPMYDDKQDFKGYFGIMRPVPCPLLTSGKSIKFDPNSCLLFKPKRSDPPNIFIGHGRNRDWEDLRDHLRDKHGFGIEAYETGINAGLNITDALNRMLNKSTFAIIVLTAEDEHAEGTFHARENVIHELGLFHGRLGYDRVAILREESTKVFSNISGITQIPYQSGHIMGTVGEIIAMVKDKHGKNM